MSGSAKNQNALLKLFEPGLDLSNAQIRDATGLTERQVTRAAGTLVEKGLLQRSEQGIYALTGDGEQALTDGVVFSSGPNGPYTNTLRSPAPDTLRQKAWIAMRMMKKFSTADLVPVVRDKPSATDHANLQRFCRALMQAGYLYEFPSRQSGAAESSNGFKRYRLMRDTGEIAPTYRNTKKEVFDHNTSEVFPCQAVRS